MIDFRYKICSIFGKKKSCQSGPNLSQFDGARPNVLLVVVGARRGDQLRYGGADVTRRRHQLRARRRSSHSSNFGISFCFFFFKFVRSIFFFLKFSHFSIRLFFQKFSLPTSLRMELPGVGHSLRVLQIFVQFANQRFRVD